MLPGKGEKAHVPNEKKSSQKVMKYLQFPLESIGPCIYELHAGVEE
jgi:hypothetical protein